MSKNLNKDNDMDKAIIEKIAVGDGLTDQELDTALEFYTDLVDKLTLLGPTFRLARNECLRIQQALEGFKRFREGSTSSPNP